MLSRTKLYTTLLFVFIISTFLIIVPQNIYSTISHRNFMTYMGIGECDMRIDIQQVDDITSKMLEISSVIEGDGDIKRYTMLTSYMFDMKMDDGSTGKLKIELGDQSSFPITYNVGAAPQSTSEIAISSFVAEDIQKNIGDMIWITIDGKSTPLTICGIYSDITNGGKTAKAIFETNKTPVLWSVIPIELGEKVSLEEKIWEYKELFPYAKVSNINEYIRQSFGTTAASIKKASYFSIIVSALLTIMVTLLFQKMLISKDKYSISVLKSLGFRSKDIQKQYMMRTAIVLSAGILLGTVIANTLGELIGAGLISSFGVSKFKFEINPLFAYLFSPALMAVCVYYATRLGIGDIVKLDVSSHIKE